MGWVIVPVDAPLVRVLSLHPRWRRAYSDDVAAVFVRAREGGGDEPR